jgi:hypothetical protein
MKGNGLVDPSIRKGIQRRRDWIRRYPGTAGDYIRLQKTDREKVDRLFMAQRKLKSGEVTNLVERLTEERLKKRRVGDIRAKALASMRRFSNSDQYRDKTVVANVKKMTPTQLRLAAASSVDELTDLARIQEDGNPFFYH